MKRGKNKKANSRHDFVIRNKILSKSKRSQGVFGMSFGMIFSIILIVFLIVVAFIAIKYFLGTGDCVKIGLFVDGLEKDINEAWSGSHSSSFEFSGNLPSKIDYVCFANLSKSINGNDLKREIASDIGVYEFSGTNMFFYPVKNACEIPAHKIKHLDLEEITKKENPYCFENKNGRVVIKIEKGANKNIVKLS